MKAQNLPSKDLNAACLARQFYEEKLAGLVAILRMSHRQNVANGRVT